jgi:predicted peptidase
MPQNQLAKMSDQQIGYEPTAGTRFIQQWISEDGKRKRFYCAYLPKGWKQLGDHDKTRWPIILFIHGHGECGSSFEDAKKIVNKCSLLGGADLRDQNFIIIAPQFTAAELIPLGNGVFNGQLWQECKSDVARILKKAEDSYGADLKRACLTGASLGGCAAWDLGVNPPLGLKWAAVAPFAGRGDTSGAAKLVQTPVWAFVNADDEKLHPNLYSGTVNMVQAIKDKGGQPRATVWSKGKYECTGHNCWEYVFADDSKDDTGKPVRLYEWFKENIASEK